MKTCNQQRGELCFPAILLVSFGFLLLKIQILFCQHWNPRQTRPFHHSHLAKDTRYWFTYVFWGGFWVCLILINAHNSSKPFSLHIKLWQLSSMANWLTGPSLEHLNLLFGCSRESEGTQLSASNSKPGGGAECSRLHWLYVYLCVCVEDEKNPGRHFCSCLQCVFLFFFLKRLRLFQNICVYIYIRHFIIILITHNSHK